jgi:CO dehydrogenase maturation factor
LVERSGESRNGREADAPDTGDRSRIVITGKGGVGKTTLSALLARTLARRGRTVLAVDADAQMNLAWALGMAPADATAIVPLIDNADYVEEKTGARPGSGWGMLLRLNPQADDAVERFSVGAPDGVRLLVMGSLHQAAAGCLCPENTLLAGAMAAVALRPGELIVMDTQAGLEHFGRALARGFGQALVVTDPSFNGVSVALRTAELAAELGIPTIHLVVNRVRGPSDVKRVERYLDGAGAGAGAAFASAAFASAAFASRHYLPEDERVWDAEPAVDGLLDGTASPFGAAVADLADSLALIAQGAAGPTG